MNQVSLNRNPTIWTKKSEAVKIISLNCAGLQCHFDDIKMDKKLLKANIMCIYESSLQLEETDEHFTLPGYAQSLITIGAGKGIASYYIDSESVVVDQDRSL